MNTRLVWLILVAMMASACGRTIAPPVATAPRYPDYIYPTLSVPDAAQAPLLARHDTAWRWFQSGDLVRAERGFQDVLQRSPQFYPSETALGYIALVRQDASAALAWFDRVLQTHGAYVPALIGRGEALLAGSREADALEAFEAALKADPQLAAVGRRVEVLRARALQEHVAAARRAAEANQLDEAARLYARALDASPDSAFLVRDLAEVEARRGRVDEALVQYRRALELDRADATARIRIAEILDARGDLDGALAMYREASALDGNPEIGRRMSAIEARLAYLKLPAEYRAIPEAPTVTRGDLASLLGLRLDDLLSRTEARGVVITDSRSHWALPWIMAVAQAGMMEVYDNHTFQPLNVVTRSDLAQTVARVLKMVGASRPALLKDWQSRMQKMADVSVSNLRYADASLSVAAGILPLAEDGRFQLSRPVSGTEAIDAVDRLERLYASLQ
jgi:tetratricopeptide (TPR) repeat protein